MSRPPSIVVVRQGSTPIVNRRLARLVGSVFPDHEIRDVDVLTELRSRKLDVARVGVQALLEQRVQMMRGRSAAKKGLLTSHAFGRFVRALVRERTDGGTRFVLQSQSLFNAGVEGIPLIVYTDHVHLANLSYPAFDQAQLWSEAALRREADLYARADLVLVRSTNIGTTLRRHYGVDPTRIAVVGVGPNTPPRPATADRSWRGGRIVFAGYDWERKGGPDLVAAFERIVRVHPTARLDIVGVRREVAVRSPPGVTFHGRQPVDVVAQLLDGADIFCLPTLAEPFGVAFIEAMLAGLPVVGTDLGAQPDFIIPGQTGELVQPGDVDALAIALARLVSDPTRTLRLGRAAACLARERYTWPRVMSSVREAIEECLASRVAAAGTADSHAPTTIDIAT